MRLSVKNLQDYLVQFAYGKEMQKLKAFEEWSNRAWVTGEKPTFCDMCNVPAFSGLKECQDAGCNVRFCDRSYCNESVVHVCPSSGQKSEFCNKECSCCQELGCDKIICIDCSEKCFICKFSHCKDHYVRLNEEIICNQCVEDASNKLKKRKIDGDR